MSAALEATTAEGRVVLSFPESAMKANEREDFISFTKAEWLARQSRFAEKDASGLAEEIDSGWWTRNRERILRSIGGE